MKLIIDGTLISNKDFISGNGNVDSTSITISDADAEGTKIVVGNSLTLSGAAYQIIKTKLIDDPEGVLKFVTAEIYIDGCCENDVLIFSGIIRGDSVDWCEDGCTCDVDLIEDNEDILAMKCIKSTLVSDNYAGFHQQNHPRIVYCIEYRPDILFFFVMTNAWITNLTFSLITPLVAVVSLIYDIIGVIINAINSLLPGDPIGWDETPFNQDSILDAWRELKDRQNQNLIGCGRKHPSPFVRAYIVNVCAKCGLTFESSILNDPQSEYYNTMYFNAPVEKGTRNDNIKYIYENRPLQTLDLFLDSLKTVFNARWDIQGGVLRFERKDFFWNGVADLNYSALKGAGLIKDPLCYKWRSDRRPAFGMFKYAEDGADTCGNEALFRFNGVGEWNQPYNPLQSGHEDIFVPFGVARFRNDGIGGSGFGSATGDPWAEFESMPGIGQTIAQYQGVMILHKHVAFNPRLLIWDGVDGDSARVKADWLTPDQTPFGTYYNFPYSFIPMGINPNTAYPTTFYPGNLYSRFWSINNPKTFPDQGKEWEFSFYYNCESLSIINDLKYILLPIGIGRVTNVSLNSQDQSILISGQI